MRRLWLSGMLLGMFWLLPTPAHAFSIIAPADGTVLRVGETITVRIDPGPDTSVSRVYYLWYRQEDEPVTLQQAVPALVATGTNSPPYGGILRVPADMVGTLRLLAVAEVARGRLAGGEEFDEILVRAESPSELMGVEFETEKPWRLKTIGKLLEVPVVGQFADGVMRRIAGSSAGSSYRSSDEQIVTVNPEGIVRVIGTGRATLFVMNRGKQGQLDVSVQAESEPNRLPMARGGPDVTVKGGTMVALSGLQSSDPDGDPLQYQWAQVRGHKVSLLDPDTPRATFVAPKVSAKRLLQFRLRVTDMKGPDTIKGADSEPVLVNVWVEP
jgi:hypothetical protein